MVDNNENSNNLNNMPEVYDNTYDDYKEFDGEDVKVSSMHYYCII